ncbi:MAG: DEAD/DEAH box helicase family protein [Bacteroidales bacterium]|nr:DEAD/DEAH box helicase family protein [Bacteroidales bacterium]
MKNFDFIQLLAQHIPSFAQLHKYCDKAEIFQCTYPEESATNARKALEWLVKQHLAMKHVVTEKHETLNEMLKRPEMDDFADGDYVFERNIHTVKKIGNFASHIGAQQIKKNDAFVCLRSLYYVVCGFLYRWDALISFQAFDATLVPKGFPGLLLPDDSEPVVAQDVVDSVPQEVLTKPSKVIPNPKESLESEAITRKCLIDYMLNEAKWEINPTKGDIQGNKACIEIKVDGMPTAGGKGFCDYVLFSRGGKPLAVIEAKSTIKSAISGRQQAILYADCLEKKYGVRPVIYYTNGFETKFIDGLGYPDREVIAFHSHDDLEYLIQKRGRADIKNLHIDENITDRPYQKTAIKSLVEWLNKKHRRGLLVLATGTGKTRVSISLCKLLSNNNWIKNVLFLADRTELVNQANNNFQKLLPSETMTCLSDDEEPDFNARFVFSTYQTMINYINAMEMKFSVGHFDLIIIDEAHRSVFGTYGAIFQYFDSLLIGLTATPRNEIDKNTFRLLELDNEPNFEYTFEEAVKDGYLVPYKVKLYNSHIINEGIKYDELSPEQRNELEKVWKYEKALKGISQSSDYHRDIESNEIFRYLINDDTIDQVLLQLMDNGIKVHSGEDIGKTIIFAYNHTHAERIVQRFYVLFPERGNNYCQLIDNQVKYRGSIIRDFKSADSLPQIAVSVDMLDTGIDVPEILNLVFFKIVKSKIKFEQMIGRGTRLCPDIFGPGSDKKLFYIFDWCGNFEYFSKSYDEISSTEVKSLTQKLFELRLDIAKELQSAEHQELEFDKNFHDELKKLLHQQLNSIVKERKDARKYWSTIEPFLDFNNWICLSEVDVMRLKEIAKLVPTESFDESAKKFDIALLNIQLSLLDKTKKAGQSQNLVIEVSKLLEQRSTVPAVMAHIETIKKVQTPQFWQELTSQKLEQVRLELRDLVVLLENSRKNRKFIIDINDACNIAAEDVTDFSIQTSYKQRVVDYLFHNTNNATLRKIQNFEQLTADDFIELERIFFEQLGTKAEFDNLTKGHRYNCNVAAFIRVVNGIDHARGMEIYRKFISDNDLTADQEMYLKEILNYVSANGDIETKNFMERPFNLFNWRLVFGDNFVYLKEFVHQIHKVITA